ncbi:hypothetical protein ACFL6C_10885, partial [Myxococcota bacterium]
MSNINDPSGVAPPATPQTAPTSPEAPAQASMTSLPHTNLDSNVVQKQVDALFQRAGLIRGGDGGLLVKDSAAVGKSTEVAGLSNFEQVYGAGESQLRPAAPPKIEFSNDTRLGAESFAQNMDRVVDDILVRPKTQQPIHTKPTEMTTTAEQRVPTQGPTAAATEST